MLNRQTLLADLQKLLQRLEADLLQRSESAEVPEVGERLRGEYERAKKAERTAMNYEDWRSATITQSAAAWVLSCVFVRFLEDNQLIDPPKIAGPGERLRQARDEWELYLGQAKQPNERDYLLGVFDELARLPGGKDIFGEHNPVHELPNWLSGDGARALLTFFQKIDPESGALVHDFTDPNWETRFLGNLYQDLSEAARKRYALLQTPEFVEEFILQRTLEPALDEFFVVGSSFLANDKPGNNQEQTTKNQEPFRMIDPACGSGHFLLGSFRRILDRWQKQDPGAGTRELVRRTLASIHGVDVNPYAVAIARFRLLLVAMRAEGVTRLAHAPGYQFNLACGDSLWHSPLRGTAKVGRGQREFDALAPEADDSQGHTYFAEDPRQLTRLLEEGRYHAVVANPPYITPKDSALSREYRNRYESCHRQYSLAVPFMERIFRLAVRGGYTGQITANSFMKREFGKKLIEKFLPGIDLTHVIDTSGAYIPGHGTPTVILFGRSRQPVARTIRAVMGIRGEPSTPDDPARGLVWTAILNQIDQPGSQSQFVSVADSARELFKKHPWSIGGGGAAELKEALERSATSTLSDFVDSVGRTVSTQGDDVFVNPVSALRRRRVDCFGERRFVSGDEVRDWIIMRGDHLVFPYDDLGKPIDDSLEYPQLRFLWRTRTSLANTFMFERKTKVEVGMKWFEYGQWLPHRFRTPLSIVYGEVATHNHFVLDRGGKVFNRTAPVIKLPPEATEDDHLALLGLLNSSTACFWMKQVCHNKGSTVDQHHARQRTSAFEDFFAFNGTSVGKFPLPEGRPTDLARELDTLAQRLQTQTPDAILTQRREHTKKHRENQDPGALAPLREALTAARRRFEELRGQMIFLQEELDWQCYELYGLIDEGLTPRRQDAKNDIGCDLCVFAPSREPLSLQSGQRSFEIVLARRMARGETETTWFKRHGTTPITEVPTDWPNDYRRLIERRIELIEKDRNIGLIEQPEYKRRWNTEPWESQLERALRKWLLDRLESYFDFDGRMGDEDLTQRRKDAKEEGGDTTPLCDSAPLREISLCSVARLADVASQDPQFMEVGEVYRDDKAFDVQRLVEELVTAESVPLLPVLRYKATGLRKRAEWEKTWELQREEDRISGQSSVVSGQSSVEETDNRQLTTDNWFIPVPPKYTSADFLSGNYWRLRGKLDVPKERWVSFPHCEGTDGTLLIAWAGYNHLQLAQAVSAYYVDVQERLGGRDDPRLVPLLACLLELVPWLQQWHNEPDAAFDGMRMGDYFEGFVQEEARQLGKTLPEIKAWEPPKKTARRKMSRTSK